MGLANPVNVGGVDVNSSVTALSVRTDGVLYVYNLGGGGGGGAAFSAGVSNLGNTSGITGTVSSQLIFAGGNNITLSQSIDAFGGATITISGANQSVQTQDLINALSLSGNTAGALALISSGTAYLAGGNNITLSQQGNSITISGPNAVAQTNQTLGIYASSQTEGQSSSSTYDARSLSIVGSDIISVGWTNGSLVIDATTAQSVQTQNLVSIDGSTGSIVFTAGNNITLSQNASTITISAFNQSVQTQNLVSIDGSTGSIVFTAGNNITLSQNASTITISAFNQTVQTQNCVDVSLSGNTAGALALVSSGTLILAGGNNITLSQNGQSVTISGPNAAGAQTGISGIIVSNTTYTSGTVSFSNANGISFGSSAGQAITASYTVPNVPAQTNQTLGIYASSQTVGQSSSSTYDARSLTIVGQGNISVGWSNSSLVISETTAAQTNQTLGIYASSQTYGQSSSSTFDARSLTFVGSGNCSVGESAGSILISVAPGGGGGATSAGVYASSQTIGQSSSSTYPLASLTIVGSNNISVGWTNGSLLIADTLQSVQTQNCVDATLAGNTSGVLALVSSGTLTLAGGNNITLSQNGNAVTISQSDPAISYYELPVRGAVFSGASIVGQGNLYLQPFFLQAPLAMYRMHVYQSISGLATSTVSISGSVSGGVSTAGTGSFAITGTMLLMSRQSSGTNANSSNLISFYSKSYSYGLGISDTVSWNTNVSSASVSFTTSAAAYYIGNIDSAGGVTTTSNGVSGSSTFSSTAAAAASFSSSFVMTVASQLYSGIRAITAPMNTTITQGDYWLGMIQSSNQSNTQNAQLGNILRLAPFMIVYTSNTQGYLPLGASASTNNSNVQQGWGSYGTTANTTTSIQINQVTNMSQWQTWFNMMAETL